MELQTAQQAQPQLFFMPGMFNDTLKLLSEAHEYFFQYGAADQASLSDEHKRIYTAEMSRITLRLSSAMAWIMLQRAVVNNKISPEEAKEKLNMDFAGVCLIQRDGVEFVLPEYMCSLLDRSRELFSRVARLNGITVH